MLMHTSGILVMTPESAMVLTGKQAIDYSGGVSAEDNLGIGGYARIMGPNGEAQYFAPTIGAAVEMLQSHYRLTYRAPGERWPRRIATADPSDRDVRSSSARRRGQRVHRRSARSSPTTANRDRKKPFDIRTVIAAVVDADHEVLERWPEMAEAETAVVCDARLGGLAVTILGIESRPLPRHGPTPADGPAQWSAGTLFPLSSKKVARAINAANGKRPVVMLANLSGFDGSPESLRRLQLEYGAEIGRALVNFDGPFVLCVDLPVSRRGVRRVLGTAQRRHGGARRRGVVRLGDRRCAGGCRRVHPCGRRANTGRRASAGARTGAGRGARGGGRPAPRRSRQDPRPRAHREARRGRRRVRRHPQRRAGQGRRIGAPHHRRRRPPP